MTICIAAIAGKDRVVIASDRMVTLAVPSTEFEQGLPKTIRALFCQHRLSAQAAKLWPEGDWPCH